MLSKKSLDILTLLDEAGELKEIANKLNLSERAIRYEIENLNYQSAKLTVKTSGVGTVEYVILDGEKVDFIPYGLTGNHIVHIKLKN